MGEEKTGVDPDIAFGVMLGRLLTTAHLEEFGNPDCDQAGFVEQVEPPGRIGAGQNLGEFIANTLG